MNLFNIIATAAANAGEAAAKTAEAAAQSADAAKQAPAQQGNFWGIAPFFIIIIAMFFLTARANKKQKARQQEMINKLAKGAKVILNSGIMGTVVEVKEEYIKVEIAANCVIQVLPASIIQIVDENKESDK